MVVEVFRSLILISWDFMYFLMEWIFYLVFSIEFWEKKCSMSDKWVCYVIGWVASRYSMLAGVLCLLGFWFRRGEVVSGTLFIGLGCVYWGRRDWDWDGFFIDKLLVMFMLLIFMFGFSLVKNENIIRICLFFF